MTRYWLDADVLIQAKNTFYAFDIAPGFWEILEQSAEAKLVCSPMMVHDEIMKGGDELTKWAKLMRANNLFIEADQAVQRGVGTIGAYVRENFDPPYAKVFLEGADPWVISAAAETKGIVVTHESLGGLGCKRVKIPNVCQTIGVDYINCYEMLRRLGKRLKS